jgi:hypothetical protein
MRKKIQKSTATMIASVAILAVVAMVLIIPSIINEKHAIAQTGSQSSRSPAYWCYNFKPSTSGLGAQATSRPISDMPEKCFPASSYTEYQCDQFRSSDQNSVQGQFCYRVTQSR